MTKLPAYAVHGEQLTGEMLRLVANAVSSGARGIARPNDLKVTASTAGNVSIAPGGALLPTLYASSPQFQTYAVGSTAAELVPIPPTGSGSGATRYVIARIEDPQYGGQDMGAPNWDFNVVGSITNLPYPFVELAKIVQPANTSVITDAMITDLRKVALPRTERHVVVVPSDGTYTLTSSTFVNYLAGYTSDITPEWATRLIVRADVIGVLNNTANLDGFIKIMYAGIDVGVRRFDINWNGATERHDIAIVGEADISSRQGVNSALQLRARRANGSGKLVADSQTSVIFEYEFIEAPA